MRHSRYRRGRGLLLSVATFAALGAVAIFAGYFLGTYLVSSISTGGDKLASGPGPGTGGGPTEAAVEVTLRETKFYRVQLGSFNSPENARALAAKLAGEGFPAYVTPGGPYKVWAGVVPARVEAEAIAGRLTDKGYEPWVGPLEFDAVTLKVPRGLGEAYSRLPGFLVNAGRAMLGGEGDTAWKGELESLHASLSSPGAQVPERLLSVYEVLLRAASDIAAYGKTGRNEDYVKAMMDYMEAVDRYGALQGGGL